PVNTRAPKHVTGGSSCGSAAAVAAGVGGFALCTHTAGTLPGPGAFCGPHCVWARPRGTATTNATSHGPRHPTGRFPPRDPAPFRKVGHALLQGAKAEIKIERLFLAENFFRHAEASMDQALWDAIGKLKSALPEPGHMEIASEEEIAAWRNAFRLIQGFEI